MELTFRVTHIDLSDLPSKPFAVVTVLAQPAVAPGYITGAAIGLKLPIAVKTSMPSAAAEAAEAALQAAARLLAESPTAHALLQAVRAHEAQKDAELEQRFPAA